ncbi:MAG: histidine phosphatase family protein [Nitrososphaerales archaeon]
MALVMLMRHGEAENNVQHVIAGRKAEYHLTEKGRMQVRSTAEKLKAVSIDAIYTSPVIRTVETSQIVSETIGGNYTIDERLTETDMGSLVGMRVSEVPEKYGDLFQKFYNGDVSTKVDVERFSAIGSRMNSMLDYVAEKYADKNVLLVTHLDPIKAAITQIMDLKPEVLFNMTIKNASLTILNHSSKDYTLSAFNVMDISRYSFE